MSERDFGSSDLSNALVIKANLGKDYRRATIHNVDITRDELILMLQRLFKGKFTANDEILLKWKDDDGDMITIMDDADLKQAIQVTHLLKISIFTDKDDEDGLETNFELNEQENLLSVKALQEELRQICDMDKVRNRRLQRCIEFAQRLGNTSNLNLNSSNNSDYVHTNNASPDKSHKEFDPLNDKRDNSTGLSKGQGDLNEQPATIQPVVQHHQISSGFSQPNFSQNPPMTGPSGFQICPPMPGPPTMSHGPPPPQTSRPPSTLSHSGPQVQPFSGPPGHPGPHGPPMQQGPPHGPPQGPPRSHDMYSPQQPPAPQPPSSMSGPPMSGPPSFQQNLGMPGSVPGSMAGPMPNSMPGPMQNSVSGPMPGMPPQGPPRMSGPNQPPMQGIQGMQGMHGMPNMPNMPGMPPVSGPPQHMGPPPQGPPPASSSIFAGRGQRRYY